MKNHIRKITTFAFLFLVFCSTENAFAQIKTGGYKKIPATDAQAVAAAEFAVTAQGEKEELEISLDKLVKAERQVVAGTNFKLCLSVIVATPDEDVTEQFVQTIVFRDLKNVYSVKSWVEIESCDE